MPDDYRSDIPETAIEQIVETYPDGRKERAEYTLDGEIVGIRLFSETGHLELENPIKGGKIDGVHYEWNSDGQLHFAEPYVGGDKHGVVKQWDRKGNLLGTFTMDRGTGIDLWWAQDLEDDSRYLIEAHYLIDGAPHGYEWWFDPNQRVRHERQWFRGQWHGVERVWNNKGRLRRGYPKYFVRGEQVNKAKYLKACLSDPTLPPFRKEDNEPTRDFPPEIVKHLRIQ